MLRFHNAVTGALRAQVGPGVSPRDLFEQARRTVQWHYQWLIVNVFLPLTIGQERLDDILNNGTMYFAVDAEAAQEPAARDGREARNSRESGQSRGARRGRGGQPPASAELRIPVEFSVAAYRFGHWQIRPSYRLNFGPEAGKEFFAFVVDDSIDPRATDPNDLRGGVRAPRRFVDWQTFFDFGDGNARPNKLIDTKLSSVLMALPGSRAPAPGLPADGVQSLSSRNLIRHVNFGLPSGQAIAAKMGVPVLSPAQMPEMAAAGLAESTPLWYCILKEAEMMEKGQRLGPVGARIVGEVFIGLLDADANSCLSAPQPWKPTLPAAGGPGTFRSTDLLRFAGVVPPLQ